VTLLVQFGIALQVRQTINAQFKIKWKFVSKMYTEIWLGTWDPATTMYRHFSDLIFSLIVLFSKERKKTWTLNIFNYLKVNILFIEFIVLCVKITFYFIEFIVLCVINICDKNWLFCIKSLYWCFIFSFHVMFTTPYVCN